MNKIDSVKINGFWGDRSLDINFFSDVNLFIGVNGTGKTTIINIIAAALLADFATLDRLPFQLIRIDMSEVGGLKKPTIEVEKVRNEESPYQEIIYRIREKASVKFKIFSLDDFEEETFLRRQMSSRQQHMYRRSMSRGILAKLQSIVNVSWLSIHRGATSRNSPEESYESSVDQKLEELSFELGKYFSVLSAKVSDEISKFQKNIILSLLTEQSAAGVFSSVKSFDMEEEKKALYDIFNKLKIDNKTATQKLEKHFLELKSVREKDIDAGLNMADLMSLINAYRSNKIVQDWNSLLKTQAIILSPKTTFIEVLNGLFQNKTVHINEKNEIEAITKSGKSLSIRGLSSGEKQLIIILGQALLQQSAPWIYIADEPELSLHVSWQENLIENLRRLNPQAQIICATHSPDVVSTFSDNVFDMEDQIH